MLGRHMRLHLMWALTVCLLTACASPSQLVLRPSALRLGPQTRAIVIVTTDFQIPMDPPLTHVLAEEVVARLKASKRFVAVSGQHASPEAGDLLVRCEVIFVSPVKTAKRLLYGQLIGPPRELTVNVTLLKSGALGQMAGGVVSGRSSSGGTTNQGIEQTAEAVADLVLSQVGT